MSEYTAARKLLEKKKTVGDGIERLRVLAEGGVSAEHVGAMLDAVQRCKTVLVSRHDDPALWGKARDLFTAAEQALAGSPHCDRDTASLREWAEQLDRADPARTAPAATDTQPPAPAPPSGPSAGGMNPLLTDLLASLDLPEGFDLSALEEGASTTPAARKALHDLMLFRVPHNTAAGEFTCAVCLDDLPPRSKAKSMPCKHLFHEKCLLEWLAKNSTCPVCRFKLPSQEKLNSIFAEQYEAEDSKITAAMFS